MGKNLGDLLSKIRLLKSFKSNDLIRFKGFYDYIFLDFYFDDYFCIKTLSREGDTETTEYNLSEFLEIEIEKDEDISHRESFFADLRNCLILKKSQCEFIEKYLEINNKYLEKNL